MKSLLLITIPTLLVLLLLLEIFFRFVIPASDPPGGFFDEKEKIYSFPNKRESGLVTTGRFAEIKASWRINNMRWNYPIDYFPVKDKKLIAVIGDSYIEAFQVDAHKNYPYLLRNSLYPEYDVYAFGKSGASFSQYLHISRYVKKHFNPDILVFNIIHNDFNESLHELHPERHYFMQLSYNEEKDGFTETTPIANYSTAQFKPWKRWLHKSALFRYLYMNLNLSAMGKAHQNRYEANIDPDEVISHQTLIYKAVDYIIGKVKEENPGKRIIYIFDGPRSSIYENTLSESKVWWLHEIMDEICRSHGVEYIDLTEPMRSDFEKTGKKFNSELDGHWDAYGHQFVAKILYEYILNN